jgi:hypothetical protein
MEEERSAIDKNDEFTIEGCFDKPIESINAFLVVSKATARALSIFEI